MHLLSLLLIAVVISGALCTDFVLTSQCARNKAIHIAHDGKVSVTGMPTTQIITIKGTDDFVTTNSFKLTLYAKETQMYLCFNNHWRLVGMKEAQDSCYFTETMIHGYFEFRSYLNQNKRIGFTHRGKPVGPKKHVNDACYHFGKVEAAKFFNNHTTPKPWSHFNGNNTNSNAGGISSSRRNNNLNKNNSNNNNKDNNNNKHRVRHQHNATEAVLRRQQHSLQKRLRHQSQHNDEFAVAVAGVKEVGNSSTPPHAKRKKKKKRVGNHQNNRNQYLNPKDPTHRQLVLQEHHDHHVNPQHTHKVSQHDGEGGEIDDLTNSQDEYSNDDASAILPDLPNNLDSLTDYVYSSSSNAKHSNKNYLGSSSTNRKKLTSSNLSRRSSGSRSTSSNDGSNVDVINDNNNDNISTLDGHTAKKYYKKNNSAVVVAVKNHTNSTGADVRENSLSHNRLTTDAEKTKGIHRDKSSIRTRKRLRIGS